MHRASAPLPEPVAARYVAFQAQLDLEAAGVRPPRPLRMPASGPWVQGETCISCDNRTRWRRCPDCTAALKAILASERARIEAEGGLGA